VDDKDTPHYAELVRVLGEVDGWLARIDPAAAPPRPPPGSPYVPTMTTRGDLIACVDSRGENEPRLT
jgi:hypothetical protein